MITSIKLTALTLTLIVLNPSADQNTEPRHNKIKYTQPDINYPYRYQFRSPYPDRPKPKPPTPDQLIYDQKQKKIQEWQSKMDKLTGHFAFIAFIVVFYLAVKWTEKTNTTILPALTTPLVDLAKVLVVLVLFIVSAVIFSCIITFSDPTLPE